jgi:hypothetical protein
VKITGISAATVAAYSANARIDGSRSSRTGGFIAVSLARREALPGFSDTGISTGTAPLVEPDRDPPLVGRLERADQLSPGIRWLLRDVEAVSEVPKRFVDPVC